MVNMISSEGADAVEVVIFALKCRECETEMLCHDRDTRLKSQLCPKNAGLIEIRSATVKRILDALGQSPKTIAEICEITLPVLSLN